MKQAVQAILASAAAILAAAGLQELLVLASPAIRLHPLAKVSLDSYVEVALSLGSSFGVAYFFRRNARGRAARVAVFLVPMAFLAVVLAFNPLARVLRVDPDGNAIAIVLLAGVLAPLLGTVFAYAAPISRRTPISRTRTSGRS